MIKKRYTFMDPAIKAMASAAKKVEADLRRGIYLNGCD
jgi:hypothetical protein